MLIILYAIGYIPIWIMACLYMENKFPSEDIGDTMMAVAWGFLVAVVWPLILICFIIALALRGFKL